MKKQIMEVLLTVCVFVASVFYPAESTKAENGAAAAFVGLDAQYRTQYELKEYYKSHPILNLEAQYVIPPSVTPPYALGELTEATKQDALNMLNLYRYIAGVPTVSITDEAQKYAQAAALLNAINERLSHFQTCPKGMSEELYELGANGSFNSNLARFGNRFCETIQCYMMETNGDSNFGHRRQLLEYYYDEAGFGMVQSASGCDYSSVFVDAYVKEDKIISYPGQNQPLEYFGAEYAWTVIIPKLADKSGVHVKITDMKTGNTWNFEQGTGNLRLASWGRDTCAIFWPKDIEYKDGDRYKVEITGIEKPISYEVNMFLLEDPVPLEYKYKITGTSSVSLTGLNDNSLTNIVIPDAVKIGGKQYKVTAIANGAFKNQKIRNVTIGANVEVIGKSAFAGCTRLLKVVIGSGVKKIKANAFLNCKKLKNITVKSFCLKSVGKKALKNIKARAVIRVPKKKLRMYKKLFKGKGQSKKVTIKRK